MTHNDKVLDFMINQLRSHLQTAYVPADAVKPATGNKDTFVINGLRTELESLHRDHGKLQKDFKSATDGVLRRNEQIQQMQAEIDRKDVQLAACHENQKNYREEIVHLKAQLAQQQGHISESNRVNQDLRDELNVMRKKEFGAAVGVKDVNKLLERVASLSSELSALKKQAGIKETGDGFQPPVSMWDGSVEIGSPWHKDAC